MAEWSVTPNEGVSIEQATGEITFPPNTGSTDIDYTVYYTDDNGCSDGIIYTVPKRDEDKQYYCENYKINLLMKDAPSAPYDYTKDSTDRGGDEGISSYDCNGELYTIELKYDEEDDYYPPLYHALDLEYLQIERQSCDDITYEFCSDMDCREDAERFFSIKNGSDNITDGIIEIMFNGASYDEMMGRGVLSFHTYINVTFHFEDSRTNGVKKSLGTIIEFKA